MTTEPTPDVDPADSTVDTPAGTTPPDTTGVSVTDLRIKLDDRAAYLRTEIDAETGRQRDGKAKLAELKAELDDTERLLKAAQPRTRKPRKTAAKKAAAK